MIDESEINASEREPVTLISRGHEDVELEHLQYHPLMRAKIEDLLDREQAKLAVCKPDELLFIQGTVFTLKLICALPERVLAEVRDKEKEHERERRQQPAG